MNMKLHAVLFDLDDTLHDKSATLRIVADKQFRAAELGRQGINKVNWEFSFVELNNLRIEKSEVYELLAQSFNLPEQLKIKLLRDFDQSLGSFAVPFPGALELLNACRQHGLKIGIVTNGRDGFQRRKIEGLGFSNLVDSVVTSGGFGLKKPNHEIFWSCLRQLNVVPEHAAFVGDDFQADMEPAIALRMQSIWKSAATSEVVAFSSDSLIEIQRFLFR